MVPIASIDKILLAPTVYEPSTARLVIENAGSMLNGDPGSAKDGRDHLPTPVPQSTDYVEPASAISEDCEADAVTNSIALRARLCSMVVMCRSRSPSPLVHFVERSTR
jgi:hypothetical protein